MLTISNIELEISNIMFEIINSIHGDFTCLENPNGLREESTAVGDFTQKPGRAGFISQ